MLCSSTFQVDAVFALNSKFVIKTPHDKITWNIIPDWQNSLEQNPFDNIFHILWAPKIRNEKIPQDKIPCTRILDAIIPKDKILSWGIFSSEMFSARDFVCSHFWNL